MHRSVKLITTLVVTAVEDTHQKIALLKHYLLPDVAIIAKFEEKSRHEEDKQENREGPAPAIDLVSEH